MGARMKTLVVIGVAAALAGCVSAQRAEERAASQARAAQFKATTSQLEADYFAKKITFGQMMSRAAEARLALNPGDPSAVETTYFWKVQAARVDKGEISTDEFRYIVARYENEQNSRKRSEALQTLAAISASQASQPVSCTRIGNTVTCN